MKRILKIVLVSVGLLGAGTLIGLRHMSSSDVPKLASVRTATFPRGYPRSFQVYDEIDRALGNKDYDEAEAVVDANIDGPVGRTTPIHNGCILHEYKARLLARRGEDAASLAEYMDLLHGRHGLWPSDSRRLTPALESAIKLGRRAEADEISSSILANRTVRFASPSLDVPDSGETPNQRLAYACLIVAHDAHWNGDKNARVRWCEKAFELAPNDVSAIVQLSDAYRYRRGPRDVQSADALLRQAYAQLPQKSIARSELRLYATQRGTRFSNEEAGRSFDEDFATAQTQIAAATAARMAFKRTAQSRSRGRN